MKFFQKLLAKLRGPRRARPAPATLPPVAASPSAIAATTTDEAIHMARAVRSPDAREAELDRWLEFAAPPDVEESAAPDVAAESLPANEQHPGPSTPPSLAPVETPIEEGATNLESAEQATPEEAATSPAPVPEPVLEEVRVLLIDAATLNESPIDTERFAKKPRKAPRRTEYPSPLPAPVLEDMLERFDMAADPVTHALTGEPVTVALPRRHDATHYSLINLSAEPKGRDRVMTLGDWLRGAPDPLDVLDRLECARLVARTIHALHAADLVTSGISPSSFGVSLDGRPTLWLLEPHLLRPIGGEVLDGSLPVRGADEDRHELAGLIAELLDLRGHESTAGTLPIVPGLNRHQTGRVETLLRRAASPGRRPSAGHWLEALAA